MTIRRRLTAILLQCAVVVMPLSSDSIRCEDAGHAEHMAMSNMSMADMSMPGMSMPGMPAQGDDANGSSDSHPDCPLPWSAGLCQSMTSCAPSVMSVEESTVNASVPRLQEATEFVTRGPRSEIRAPEPPPPRA